LKSYVKIEKQTKYQVVVSDLFASKFVTSHNLQALLKSTSYADLKTIIFEF